MLMLSPDALRIFDTASWDVVLNPNQTYVGRCVVVLKRPCEDLADISEDEWLEFLGIVKKTEALLRVALDATMFNWACSMNHAYQQVPPKPQVHWHLIPRYAHPIVVGNRQFTDPNFGQRSTQERSELPERELTELATLLRTHLHEVTS